MGTLKSFQLGYFIDRFKAKTLVETGTGKGDGVRYARGFPFEEIYSIEIVAEQVEKLRPEFADDPRIHLIAGESTGSLRDLIPKIKGNAVFWLDAHFPGADLGLNTYEESGDPTVSMPLRQELEMIRDMRAGFLDVILIDDLRIYERDNFERGNARDKVPGFQWPTDSRFLYTTFEKTHEWHRFLEHEGYFVLFPKDG
jgi:hypothetical protein